jgi:hypothetical protein
MNDDTAIQLKIIEIAKKYGVDASRMTSSQYATFSLMARDSFAAKAKAIGSAVMSLAATTAGRRVSLEQVKSNEEICGGCEHFKRLADAEPACGKCGCSGKFLRSKWADPSQGCPIGKWTNLASDESGDSASIRSS